MDNQTQLSVPLESWLSRIENKLDSVEKDVRDIAVNGSKTARDAVTENHSLELRVQSLELKSASQAAVRRAVWAAVSSPIVAAILSYFVAKGKL